MKNNVLFHCDEKLEKFLNKLGYERAKDDTLFKKEYDLNIYFIFKFDWYFNKLESSSSVSIEYFELNSDDELEWLKEILFDFNVDKQKILNFLEGGN